MAKYKLNDIAPIQQGTVPKADKYWLLNLDMVESNTGRVIDFVYCDESGIGNSTVKFDTENVLYSKLRPYLNKVVIPYQAGYATSEMLPLKPNTSIITREYLTYYLRSPGFVSYINEKTSGAKMPRANSADLKAYEIDCPDLSVQNQITAQFDKLVEIINKRQIELTILDNLIKARFVEMFGDPIRNEKGFEAKPGEAIFKLSNGKFVPEHKRLESGIPVYGGNGVSWHTDEILSEDDTVVVGRVGFQSGNVHFVEGPLWISDNAMYISKIFDAGYDLRFLYWVMEHIDFTRFQDAGDLKKITQKPFMQMKYIKPPISMQHDYNDFVAQVDKSKVVVQKALDEAQLLFDSLMQQYFG